MVAKLHCALTQNVGINMSVFIVLLQQLQLQLMLNLEQSVL